MSAPFAAAMPPIGDQLPAPTVLPPQPITPTPAPRPAPQPKGLELEQLSRARLCRLIGLHVELNSPTWNQILFASKKIPIRIAAPPPNVLKAIDQLPPDPPPPGSPPDAVRTESEMLLKQLSDARPRGASPRTIAGGPKLPPAADALAKWLRRVFLVVSGPEAVRLLVAGGYLLPGDVAVLEVVYPDGLDEERKAAVGGAIALTNASMRTGVEHGLPSWLNDQLLTLMDEKRPTQVYEDVYAAEAKSAPAPGPGPQSTMPNLIAQQSAPNPATDR